VDLKNDQRVETKLVVQLKVAKRRYLHGETTLDEYRAAAKRLRDLIFNGIVPDDLCSNQDSQQDTEKGC
jgi:hypothetical protein